ncbi:MAG: ceramidase domain-containing protein [Thiotrichaceae bacterium]|nr:ceramidase domain-containing protein [Thiotrichaceae bacterium]
MSYRNKIVILIGLIILAIAVVFVVEPIPQDLAYHQFSDTKPLWGMPNFWNVLSNLPFMMAGLYGLAAMTRLNSGLITGVVKTASLLFFVGLFFTGIGSGYYHLSPSNSTLVWDRLPMTIAFMAFFTFVLAMHLGKKTACLLLWPLMMVGIASVFYWDYTESIGAGDLRFYAMIQFLPMLLIPAIVVMFPTADYNAANVWAVIAVYFTAKVSEYFDYQLYELIGISGHSLKHMIAALAGIAFLYAIKGIMPARNHSSHSTAG